MNAIRNTAITSLILGSLFIGTAGAQESGNTVDTPDTQFNQQLTLEESSESELHLETLSADKNTVVEQRYSLEDREYERPHGRSRFDPLPQSKPLIDIGRF